MKNVMLIVAFAAISWNTYAQCSNNNSTNANARTVAYTTHEKDIVDVAAGSDDFSTLVAAVKAADLVGTLKSDGPFTVFAPTNAAFSKLPDGTIATLLKPENQSLLTKILTYHVLAGKYDAAAIVNAIQLGGGEAKLATVSGDLLLARIDGSNVILVDEKGGKSIISSTDVAAKNGLIHVIDTVVIPE